ncbi:hypothetical protein FKP32DRAFT_1569386, partial [Trametes sanguinea]
MVAVLTKEQLRAGYGLPPHSPVHRSLQDVHLLLLHSKVTQFTLNTEQSRAFTIVARHLHHHESVPLLMYLGGMGGTGKSRVLQALMSFLDERQESHRFIVLGPTGTSAALVGGSTYHSILRLFSTTEKDKSVATVFAKIRGRLSRVDVIFIDEVSMISCIDLFRIHLQL